MSRATIRARELVLAGVLGVVSCLPVPVPLYVENHTTETIEVRIAGTQGGWATIAAGGTESVGGFNYDGWCSVPDRWVPEHFGGIEVRLDDGTRDDVTAARFVAEGRYERGWTYRFERR